ncbi:hypothetical protein EW145_g5138, partial [Phellinidium pouzarii]
ACTSAVAAASASAPASTPAKPPAPEPVARPPPTLYNIPLSPKADIASATPSRRSSPPAPSHPSGISFATSSVHSSSTNGFDSYAQPSASSKPYTVTQAFVYGSSIVYDNAPLPPRSLQDQMQEAYAADNMHLARVLYLKIQGIEVTSDDDPRIAQVKDDDFVFVPGGVLVLDDESLAALNEALKGREKDEQARKWRERETMWEAEAERVRVAKALAQRHQEEAHAASRRQKLDKRKGRLQLKNPPFSANPAGHSSRIFYSSQSSHPSLVRHVNSSDSSSSLLSGRPRTVRRAAPIRISFREVVQSLHGPLFPDTDPSETHCRQLRSESQDKLLDSLLQDVGWHDGDCRRAKDKDITEPRTWTCGQLSQSSATDSTCITCSADTNFTISRTNSWASSTSSTSVSTCITSPPNSPNVSQLQLPPLVLDEVLREQVHLCRPQRKGKLTSVALARTPLLRPDACDLEQHSKETHQLSSERKDERTKSPLLSRVKQSVTGFLDFASKIQQSYLRTVHFAVSLPFDATSLTANDASRQKYPALKPVGYRASSHDVLCFAPGLSGPPSRDLNLASEHNIPLASTCASQAQKDISASEPARLFAPIAFVPPSALRPRDVALTPEWRLRAVANPCMLRQRALANHLSLCGIPWEGRAHTGSLGYGRERVVGVAFEGLGGSRLAFEVK